MTDPIDDLTVRTAFQRLRADATTAIRPPGVAAAGRSVRRRRYAASAAGGLAALLVLSSGAAAALWWQAPSGTGPAPVMTAAGPSTTPGPSAGPADRLSLMETTEAALNDLVGVDAMLVLYAPGSAGEQDHALEVRGKDPVGPPTDGQPDTSPGAYHVTVVCGGAGGEATATFTTGDRTATVTATCATTAEEISAGAATTTVEAGDMADVIAGLEMRADAPGGERVVMLALRPAD